MGGEVGVESVLGKGSLFWFSALLHPAAEDGAVTQNLDMDDSLAWILGQNFADARLLLAEDMPLNCEVLQDMLDETGLKMDVAGNGEVAVMMASQTAYDLILMDMQMPVMDGLTATGFIRALPGHSATPIIALTANAFNEDRQNCINVGMNDFLSKPVSPDILYASLIKWLGKSRDGGELIEAPPEHRPEPVAAAPAPTDDYERLQSVIGTIPDFDMEMVPMAQTKPERYIRYLLTFVDENRNSIDRLRSLLSADDRQEAVRLAHSLKGVSAQIGIVGIQRMAADLEAALKNGAEEAQILHLAAETEKTLAAASATIDKLRN